MTLPVISDEPSEIGEILPDCLFLPGHFVLRVREPACLSCFTQAFHVLRLSKTDAPADLFRPHGNACPATALPWRATMENKIGLTAVPTYEALLSGVNCE